MKKQHKISFDEDSELIKDILKFKKSGRVLDLGCGKGGNSLYLAEKGFDVTCADISKTAIKRIKEVARVNEIKINAKIADLESFRIKKDYDIIICTGVFQFLSYQKGINLIAKMKKMTKRKGINVIISFTDKDKTFNKNRLYFKSKQLKELYSDWKIKSYIEFKEKDEFMMHSLAKIVAIK